MSELNLSIGLQLHSQNFTNIWRVSVAVSILLSNRSCFNPTRLGFNRDNLMILGKVARRVKVGADISEEIDRLKTHIEHFREIMADDKEVGKRLDFLTQELNREANTIASKTNNAVVKENALAIKSEIEKIREQIQNVE